MELEWLIFVCGWLKNKQIKEMVNLLVQIVELLQQNNWAGKKKS